VNFFCLFLVILQIYLGFKRIWDNFGETSVSFQEKRKKETFEKRKIQLKRILKTSNFRSRDFKFGSKYKVFMK
jgi:hypothetical protein